MRVVIMIALLGQALSAQSLVQVRNAVSRSLPVLERSAGEFVAKRACVSCHHNILPILTLDLARSRGFSIDAARLRAVEEKTFRELRNPNGLDDAIQATTVNDPTPDDSLLLMAAHDAGIPPDLTSAVYARRLVSWQQPGGHWVTSDFRPPHASSLFMTTATAVRAIRFYMPQELSAERDAAMVRARLWLLQNRPASTEDAAFRLLGLVWAEAPREHLTSAARDLAAMQRSNGGWPQLAGYESDAYSTGEALFALHEAGTPVSDPGWSRGIRFLISTEAPDGTWRVHTRMISPAEVSPKYFATGFPYGKDEFISYAGSAWAVMALLSALPEPGAPPERSQLDVAAAADTPAWLRPALLGSPQQLAGLLDAGLDPNSRTKNGTTVLMAAAPDAAKVRMLVSRGADVKARAASGNDALTIASAYRGTAAALQALLDAGAEVQAPEGVRVRNAPLVFAAMSGDLENVKLLLARGAKASDNALSQAVTFGYPDVVRTLIAAGADAGIVESSGINLLHWATITNRPAVIPVLVAAHVPIDAMDDNGFTPLMYAATIDFGDTEVLQALLRAGANRTIRNLEGRTALAQSGYYKHPHLQAALRQVRSAENK